MRNQVVIQNLKCGGCANTIVKEVSKIEGISNVEVDVETATVHFDAIHEDINPVINQLKKIGYPVSDEDNGFVTKAKSYVSCAIGRVS